MQCSTPPRTMQTTAKPRTSAARTRQATAIIRNPATTQERGSTRKKLPRKEQWRRCAGGH
eukprot:5404254-Alexandrium_andersonii.AAC.1